MGSPRHPSSCGADSTNFLEAGFRNGNTELAYQHSSGDSGSMEILGSPQYISPSGTPIFDSLGLFTDTHTFSDDDVSANFDNPLYIKPLSSEKFLSLKPVDLKPPKPFSHRIQVFTWNPDKQTASAGAKASGTLLDTGRYSIWDWAFK